MIFKKLKEQGFRILESDDGLYLFDPATCRILQVLMNDDGVYASPYDMFEAMNIRTADFESLDSFAKAVRERFDALMEIFGKDTDFVLQDTEPQPSDTEDLWLPDGIWEVDAW